MNDYQKIKFEQIDSYSQNLYNQYKETSKTSDAYLVGLSSSAIFAFFVVLYKFKELFTPEAVINIKITIAFFLISLVLIILSTFINSLIHYHYQSVFGMLRNEIPNINDQEEIKNKIDTAGQNIKSNFGYKITKIFRGISYITFLVALIYIAKLTNFAEAIQAIIAF